MTTNEVSRAGPTRRRSSARSGVLLLASLALVWSVVPLEPAGAASSDDYAEHRSLSGVELVDAWTNDDGSVDGADVNDVGDVNGIFDAWDEDSSDDPAAGGLDPPRYDKDVALCSAVVRAADPSYVDVTVVNGYPGYVCTFAVTFENETEVPVGVVPAVIVADPGLDVSQIAPPALPGLLGPGDKADGLFAVRIEQSAPQNSTLAFSIALVVAGDEDDCGNDNESSSSDDGDSSDEDDGDSSDEDDGSSEENCDDDQDDCDAERDHDDGNGQGDHDDGDSSTTTRPSRSSPCDDPDSGDDTGSSDLSLDLSAESDGGETVSFTFTVANHGAAPATEVVVFRRLSSGLTVESITVTRGAFSSRDLWEIPVLESGEFAVLTITASAQGPGVYEAIGEVAVAAGLDFDGVPGRRAVDANDFARATTRVRLGAPGPEGAGTWLLLGGLLIILLAVVATLRRSAVAGRG